LDDVGLLPALERLLQELSSSQQVETELDASCQNDSRLPENVESSVFRIVQEAASNAVRHGQAKHLRVKLSCDATSIRIDIEDDGRGFDVALSAKTNEMNS